MFFSSLDVTTISHLLCWGPPAVTWRTGFLRGACPLSWLEATLLVPEGEGGVGQGRKGAASVRPPALPTGYVAPPSRARSGLVECARKRAACLTPQPCTHTHTHKGRTTEQQPTHSVNLVLQPTRLALHSRLKYQPVFNSPLHVP